MTARTLLAAAGLLLLPVAELGYRAEPGTRLTRTFAERTRWELVDAVERVGGEERPVELPSVAAELERVLRVIDEVRAVDGGRPTALVRAFEDARLEGVVGIEVSGYGEESYELEQSSTLEGQRIAVAWDGDDEEYAAETEGGGSFAGLEVLDHDLDLLFLLPDGDVEEGDSWTVEGDVLRSLVAPGGQLGLVFASPPEGDFELLEPLQVACASLLTAAEAAGEVDGELEVTWAETVEVDGERRALLELELEVTLSRDLGERVGEVLGGAVTLPPGLRLASDWELEGEGVCAWSLDAGTARSLRLELDTTLAAAVTLSAYGTEMESEYALEGTTVLDFAFEAD